jgi:glutamine amidotransferase
VIGIIDYGMGNLLSVKSAVEYLGFDAELISSPEQIASHEKLILPGVGAFPDCIKNIAEKGFLKELSKEVLENKKPILGICLGMQVMASLGHEGGKTNGLGWFDSEVELIVPDNEKCRVPHVGWSETTCTSHKLFEGIKGTPEFYFVHSYHMKCKNANDVIATFNHGGTFTAAVAKNNIIGCQFHPEKSQEHGLIVLSNFIHKTFN